MGRRPKPSIVLKVKNKKKGAARKSSKRSSKSSQVDTLKLLQALSLSMEPATAKDHPDGELATQKSSHHDEVRKIIESMKLSLERVDVERRRMAIRRRATRYRADALRKTDVSKPCHGDGGIREIKDGSNTSRKQSISDDILSDGEDVDSELCPYGDGDSSEDDGDIFGPCEPFTLEGEENWGNLDASMEHLPADYDCMIGEDFDYMPPLSYPKAICS